MRVARRVVSLALVLLGASPVVCGAPLSAQADDRQAYLRAVGDHFEVPIHEVMVLTEWDLPPEHIPVLLDLARRAGVSTDALVALRRSGRDWSELARDYGVSAADFHVSLPEDAPRNGPLMPVYETFRSTPRGEWSSLELGEEALVHLVNLRFLSEYVGVAPARVLEAVEGAGSFVGAYRLLARSGPTGAA